MPARPDAFPLRELLEHQDFVRRIARHLVADEHGALDLEQDVWMAALARRPHRLASARAWLARVARNLAANRARGEGRRREREERTAEAAATVAGAERDFELQRRVADAVHLLDEPYRAAILLRYFEGLSHAEIAAETGAPIATVRTRLQRGLARLRDALDREHGGDREAWRHGLVLLVGRELRPTLLASAGGLLAGGVVMGTMLKVAAGAAVVAVAGWWMWPSGGAGAEPDANPSAAASADPALDAAAPLESAPPVGERALVASASEFADEPGPPRPRADAAAAEPERGWFVSGRVHGLTASEALEAEVVITGVSGFVWPPDLAASGGVAADGTFRIDVTRLVLREGHQRTPLYALHVEVDHPQRAREEVRLPATDEHRASAELDALDGPITWRADVHLRPAAAIAGRVVLPDGAPAAGAAVLAWRVADGVPEEAVADKTTCDADGRFRLRLPHGGEHALCALAEGWRPASRRASGAVGSLRELDAPLVLEEGAHLAGRVLRLGEPLADVGVTIQLARVDSALGTVRLREAATASLAWVDGRIEQDLVRTRSDTGGAWRATGLRPGLHRIHASGLPGSRIGLGGAVQGEVEVQAPANRVDLVYAYSALRFESASELPPRMRGALRITSDTMSDMSADFRSDDIPSVDGIPGATLTAEIRLEGFETWRRELVLPPPGEERVVAVALVATGPGASLELEVTAPADAPVDVVALGLFAVDDPEDAGDGDDEPLATRTAEVVDGVARFHGLEAGRFRAVLQPSDRFVRPGTWEPSYLRWVELELELAPAERARRALAFELGGRLAVVAKDRRGAALQASVELRDADGRALEVAFVAMHDSARYWNTWRLSPLAPNETFPNLAPGEYELRLSHAGLAPQVVRATVEAGRTAAVEVVLAPE